MNMSYKQLIITLDEDKYNRLVATTPDEDVARAVVDRMMLVKALKEAKPYVSNKEEKSTNELLKEIVGFDISGIKPLPEYKESETEDD